MDIRTLQKNQPWEVAYTPNFEGSNKLHKHLDHALLHILKSVGDMARITEKADHRIENFDHALIMDACCDLVMCAMRIANTSLNSADLEGALILRMQAKNPSWKIPVADSGTSTSHLGLQLWVNAANACTEQINRCFPNERALDLKTAVQKITTAFMSQVTQLENWRRDLLEANKRLGDYRDNVKMLMERLATQEKETELQGAKYNALLQRVRNTLNNIDSAEYDDHG